MTSGITSIHAKPGKSVTVTLSWFLFAAGVVAYLITAAARHHDNPEERVTPTVAQMVTGALVGSTNRAATLSGGKITVPFNAAAWRARHHGIPQPRRTRAAVVRGS